MEVGDAVFCEGGIRESGSGLGFGEGGGVEGEHGEVGEDVHRDGEHDEEGAAEEEDSVASEVPPRHGHGPEHHTGS